MGFCIEAFTRLCKSRALISWPSCYSCFLLRVVLGFSMVLQGLLFLKILRELCSESLGRSIPKGFSSALDGLRSFAR